MITQSISEARRKLSELIELARQGEDVIIIKDSKPVAALTPIDASDLELVG
jgi:prevent-host-death family protein